MIERLVESVLWNSRLVVLVPVLACILLSFGMFIATTLDAVLVLWRMVSYLSPRIADSARPVLRTTTISELVAVVDGYLLAAILFIFALGLYELFINKINEAEGSEFASRLLLIRSLDDLKDRLANVIMLIIIVKFFQQALSMKFQTPTDLLYLGIGITLVAGALFLSGRAKPPKPMKPETDQEKQT